MSSWWRLHEETPVHVSPHVFALWNGNIALAWRSVLNKGVIATRDPLDEPSIFWNSKYVS